MNAEQLRCMICGRFAPSDDPEQWRCYHCDTLMCSEEYDPCFTPHAYEDHIAPELSETDW